jgi:hypothetical protein
MKLKFILALVAMAGFSALPAFAQHGHGGGSGSGGHDSHASSSTHGGDHDGDHGKDADKDGDHHGGHGDHGTIASKLANNPQLSSKLSALLPPGTNLATASAGYKNLGQFVAAVHVSKNLGIPFDQLKATMTGPPPMSLGKAITTLAPTANAKMALKTAEKQANADLHSSDNDGDHDGAKSAAAGTAGAHDSDDKTKTP